ncbi:MAG: hypothetical protein KA338_20365, partial [Chloroflexi bacterium]|nr:hypothetical protein [Chloroflexota bacterium]
PGFVIHHKSGLSRQLLPLGGELIKSRFSRALAREKRHPLISPFPARVCNPPQKRFIPATSTPGRGTD